jgi:O-antigen ligase
MHIRGLKSKLEYHEQTMSFFMTPQASAEPNREGSVWIPPFLFLVSIPLFSGVLTFVDRSILNIVGLISAALVYGFCNRNIKLSWRGYILFLFSVLVLYVQFSKTAFQYDAADGLATFLRYVFYIIVGLVTFKKGLSFRELSTVISVSTAICLVSICIGLILGRFVLLNGVDRFMGANHSSAGLALQVSTSLFLIYLKLWVFGKGLSIGSVKGIFYFLLIVFLFYVLLLTGSRQPLLGILAIAAIHMFLYHKVLLFLLVTLAIAYLGVVVDLGVLSSNRLFLLATKLAEVSSVSDLENVRDGSLAARLNYIRVGASYIFENNLMFGAGLNGFQGIYEQATGKDGVAAHNDVLLILVEFGYFGLLLFLVLLVKYLVQAFRKRNLLPFLIIVFWSVGLSLNNLLYYHSVAILLVIFGGLSMRHSVYKTK